ncbi:MAG TPA: hypothetical protein VIW80_05480 [Pyrinomonadaceae bacterium]|jgi:hypothetical protein
MGVINSERVRQVCDEVWLDRDAILADRGVLSGEDALMRAVYWRLCKTGDGPVQSSNEYAPFLNELVRKYRDEAARIVSGSYAS